MSYIYTIYSFIRLTIYYLSVLLLLIASLFLLIGSYEDNSVTNSSSDSAKNRLPVPHSIPKNFRLEPFAPSGHLETTFFPGWSIQAANDQLIFTYDGGWFQSNNEGKSWKAMPTPSPYGSVNILTLSPTFEQDKILFAGADMGVQGDDVLRLSPDGGYSWHSPQQPVTGPIREIAISPTFDKDRTIYTVTSFWPQKVLLKSNSAGQLWQNVAYPPVDGYMVEILLSPAFATNKTLFAVVAGDNFQYTVWRSRNGAQTWQRIDKELGTLYNINDFDIAKLGQGSSILFAATFKGLMKTTNEGDSWSVVSNIDFSEIIVPFDLTTHSTIFGIREDNGRLFRSTNLGKSWTGLMANNSVDEVTLSPNYTQDQTLYARSHLKLWVSHNGGNSWDLASSNLSVSAGWGMKVIPSPNFSNDHMIFAALNSNGILKSRDGGYSWKLINLPESALGVTIAVSPNFAADQTVFAITGDSLFKSLDAGDHWVKVGGTLPYSSRVRQVRLSPNYVNDRTLFLANYGTGAFRSTDNGLTWTRLPGTDAYLTDIEVSPDYPDDPTLFVNAYNDGIARSEDGGASWMYLSSPSSSPDFDIELSPTFHDDNTLFVSYGGVFRSNDRGDSWVDITNYGVLRSGYPTIVISPNFAQDQTVIIADDFTLPYISENAGETWFPIQGIPDEEPYGLAIAYENKLLMPLISTQDAIYRYRWPRLSSLSSPVLVGLVPDDPSLVRITLPLQTDQVAQVSWEIDETVDWLTVTPTSGTLPTTLNLTVDPSKITGTPQTNLVLKIQWSLNQIQTISIPVKTFLVRSRFWLPMIRH